MGTPRFRQLVESADLLPYQDRLLENGFDDIDALCDMTEDDMRTIGISADRHLTLQSIFTTVRSGKAIATQQTPANPAISASDEDTTLLSTQASVEDCALGTSPFNRSSMRGTLSLAFSPLGSEMLVTPSIWTNITADTITVQNLLALYFCWEYPVFSSISKDHFIKDFCEGRARYCSPILLNALLALGYCHSSQKTRTGSLQAPFPTGDHYFEESQRLFNNEEDHYNLTSIQALGIWSLRELSCGRDSQSYHYSRQSIQLAIEMGLHHNAQSMDNDESVVTAATIRGAFQIHNAWALLSQLTPSCSSAFVDKLRAKASPVVKADRTLWVYFSGNNRRHQQPLTQTSHITSVSKCYLELSHLIHKTLYTVLPPRQSLSSKELLGLYTEYLSWYDLLPEAFRLGQNSTPAVLFAHIYYHFAVLQLFRPYVLHSIVDSHLLPQDICFEAAKNIRALVQAYSKLYTLENTPAAMPPLMLVSSIMQLSLTPILSPLHKSLQAETQITGQISSDIEQAIDDFTVIASCHPSATRAYYIIGFLAKKMGHVTLTQTQIVESARDGIFSTGLGGSSVAFGVLQEKHFKKWDIARGRFHGIATFPAVVGKLENPPFWLAESQEIMIRGTDFRKVDIGHVYQ